MPHKRLLETPNALLRAYQIYKSSPSLYVYAAAVVCGDDCVHARHAPGFCAKRKRNNVNRVWPGCGRNLFGHHCRDHRPRHQAQCEIQFAHGAIEITIANAALAASVIILGDTADQGIRDCDNRNFELNSGASRGGCFGRARLPPVGVGTRSGRRGPVLCRIRIRYCLFC